MFQLLRVALVLCFVLASGLSHAQDDASRAASARALFEEGIELAEHGQWDGAADRFRRALFLRDSQVIRFNLAAALAELGQVVEASESLRALLRADGVDASLRVQAEQRLAGVTPRIAKLTVSVSGAPADAQIELDGKALPAALIGVAIPVDPGPHRARMREGESELVARELVLADGGTGTLALERASLPTPAETAAAALSTPAPTPALSVVRQEPTRRDAPRDERKRKALWWGLGSGAVLVAGAVVAGVLLAPHAKKATPYRGDFEPGSVNVQVSP
jgi:hypothetical protein